MRSSASVPCVCVCVRVVCSTAYMYWSDKCQSVSRYALGRSYHLHMFIVSQNVQTLRLARHVISSLASS